MEKTFALAQKIWSEVLKAVSLPEDIGFDGFERVYNLLSVAPKPLVEKVQTILVNSPWKPEGFEVTGVFNIRKDLPILHEIFASGGGGSFRQPGPTTSPIGEKGIVQNGADDETEDGGIQLCARSRVDASDCRQGSSAAAEGAAWIARQLSWALGGRGQGRQADAGDRAAHGADTVEAGNREQGIGNRE